MKFFGQEAAKTTRASIIKALDPRALVAVAVALTSLGVGGAGYAYRSTEQVAEHHVLPDMNVQAISFDAVDAALERTADMTQRDVNTAITIKEMELGLAAFTLTQFGDDYGPESAEGQAAQIQKILTDPEQVRADLEASIAVQKDSILKEIKAFEDASTAEMQAYEAETRAEVALYQQQADGDIAEMEAEHEKGLHLVRVDYGQLIRDESPRLTPEQMVDNLLALKADMSAEVDTLRIQHIAEIAEYEASRADNFADFAAYRAAELQEMTDALMSNFDEQATYAREQFDTRVQDVVEAHADLEALRALVKDGPSVN